MPRVIFSDEESSADLNLSENSPNTPQTTELPSHEVVVLSSEDELQIVGKTRKRRKIIKPKRLGIEKESYSDDDELEDKDISMFLKDLPEEEAPEVSPKDKLLRLEELLQRSKQFSQIIADTLLESSLAKREKRSIGDNATKNKPSSLEQPKILTGATLRDYQLEGLDWLVTLYENGLNGILADEMGLGKTLQSIALLAFLYENGNKGPFLIAAPLSTVGNWTKEIARFTPTIPVVSYVGPKEAREQIRKRKFRLRKHLGIVVTSYETILRDFSHLSKFKWKFLIVDEGHRLKNINSKLIQQMKKLDTNNRLLLTGTPLQNNLDELWSLLNFILPDIFLDIDLFRSWFDFLDLKGQSTEMDTEIQKLLVENLHTILKPFLLRRLKSVVVTNLPPKREYIVYNTLSETQLTLYEAALSGNLKSTVLETSVKDYVLTNNLGVSDEVIDLFLAFKRQKGFISSRSRGSRKRRSVAVELDELDEESQQEIEYEEILDSEEEEEHSSKQTEEEFVEIPKPNSDLTKEENSSTLSKLCDAFKEALTECNLQFSSTTIGNSNPRLSKPFKLALLKALRRSSDLEFLASKIENCETCTNEFLPFMPLNFLLGAEKEAILNEISRWQFEKHNANAKAYTVLEEVYTKMYREANFKKMSNLMMQTRLICDSPYLFYYPWKDEDPVNSRLVETSGKMQVLDQLLNSLVKDHKVLIFSQFTVMLDLIEEWLEAEKQIDSCRIDGSSSQADREAEIKRFNEESDARVFLLLTRAGGLGINLVLADTVILFDSDWNPQVDLQAMDRVHRLGQTKPVIVYRFATVNTAEQVLLARADSKRKLERVVIQMGKFELLFKWATKDDKSADLAADLKRLLKETSFGEGADLKGNNLSEAELEELTGRDPKYYEKETCVMEHLELF